MAENKEIMPSDILPQDGEHIDVNDAVVEYIEDSIEDAQALRSWRSKVVIFFAIIASIFYVALLYLVYLFCSCSVFSDQVSKVPSVGAVVVIVLGVIPLFLTACIAKAVFGKRAQSESPYTPIQSLLLLMKEMKD